MLADAYVQQAHGFTYPTSLYFTYISLITVGFGDEVPRSNAGKPVFVLWSLAAIPAVTLLISDVQETLARWVIEGPVVTVLGGWLIGNIGRETCRHGLEDEEKRDDEYHWQHIEDAEKRDSEIHGVGDPPHMATVRKAHALFHGIRGILNDEEDKRYSWEEWQRWIKLLELNKDDGWEQGPISNWTWLGDEGPLLSKKESEKIWILSMCRERLEQEMERLMG
jgi:potassium channel subfamily K